MSGTVNRKRKRTNKTFGAGKKAKAAAYAMRSRHRRRPGRSGSGKRYVPPALGKVRRARVGEQRAAAATLIDYRAVGRLYLVPYFGDMLVSEIDTATISAFIVELQTNVGAKAADKEGSGKALSARSVAKALFLFAKSGS